ncbi:MAG: AAA family ATPase [Candidatus Pacebacteria bacterium]|nr:AAA family ATPase [Candidatus Paceibacterota bacterium]
MYLKRLEISGFKSFANKTVLDFPHNVTSVVGPNGSGKSNVADSIKWVLGEQSMKSLRGKKSEDIIFNGSNKKAKMSAATASLIFDNRDRKMPLDLDEVYITRKLFRNGESEYLINKDKVRLSDIIDILARSGVSQRGYCVINQGMADSILVASPAERMVIFEEATGVRKFQIKKEQTIKKLESTRKNLDRVNELLIEIEPHLNLLKRQATRAERRGEVEEELRREQKSFFDHVWLDLIKKNSGYKKDETMLTSQIEHNTGEVERIKKELSENSVNNESYDKNFEELQKKLNSLQQELNDFQRSISIVEGRIEIEREKMEKAKRPEFKPINLGYVKEKIAKIIDSYNIFLSRISDIKDISELEGMKRETMEVKAGIDALFSEIQEGRVCLKGEESFDDTDLRNFEKEKAEITSKAEQLRKDYEVVRAQVTELNRDEQEKRQAFFRLERELQARQDEINRFKDNLNNINIEVAKFEVRKEDLINEIKTEFTDDAPLLEKIQNNEMIEIKDEPGYFNHEGAEIKIRRLKNQLEQIGGIDPLIMDEYRETQQRFEFLSSQSKDLEEASESLKKVIKELDEKVEKLFKVSFKSIGDEFDRYFKIIFGGGKAGLSIKYETEEKENMVEGDGGQIEVEEKETEETAKKKIAGIEISAFPPGKKINNLSMLSGGERALTSIAILFAIIAHNPPPFSVLDEIDAALDEANSFRLSRIIKEIADKTQFIIITHNREMMNQADVLYGVTMQDDGVSKIVSVKLDELEG